MTARHDNLNRLAALCQRGASLGDQVSTRLVRALADRSIAWPAEVEEALKVENLHENVLTILASIGSHLANDLPVSRDWMRSLRRRLDRYHPNRKA
jgi:hypothetical protein